MTAGSISNLVVWNEGLPGYGLRAIREASAQRGPLAWWTKAWYVPVTCDCVAWSPITLGMARKGAAKSTVQQVRKPVSLRIAARRRARRFIGPSVHDFSLGRCPICFRGLWKTSARLIQDVGSTEPCQAIWAPTLGAPLCWDRSVFSGVS